MRYTNLIFVVFSTQFSVCSPHLAPPVPAKAFFQNASNVVFLLCHPRERGDLYTVVPPLLRASFRCRTGFSN